MTLGLREPQGVAIPFDWVTTAKAIEQDGKRVPVERFYFGPKYEAFAMGRKKDRWMVMRKREESWYEREAVKRDVPSDSG